MDAKLKELERFVTNPTIVSDGALRSAIANLMGWAIDARYYTDTGKPWAADYYARRCAVLQTAVDAVTDGALQQAIERELASDD